MGTFNFSKGFKGDQKQLMMLMGIIGVVIVIAIIFISKVIFKPPPPPPPEPKGPVYEIELKNVKFQLVEAKDRGDTLKASESPRFETYPGLPDLTTTEKFIEVTVNAMNTGKEDIQANTWDVLEIIDEDGRKFPFSLKLTNWLPVNDRCREGLKPGFTPIPCTKIYEVAKVSAGLKIKVKSGAIDDFLDLGI